MFGQTIEYPMRQTIMSRRWNYLLWENVYWKLAHCPRIIRIEYFLTPTELQWLIQSKWRSLENSTEDIFLSFLKTLSFPVFPPVTFHLVWVNSMKVCSSFETFTEFHNSMMFTLKLINVLDGNSLTFRALAYQTKCMNVYSPLGAPSRWVETLPNSNHSNWNISSLQTFRLINCNA